MPLIVCVCDYWQHRHYYNQQSFQASRSIQLDATTDDGNGNVQDTDNRVMCRNRDNRVVRRLSLQLDAISGNYLLRELLQQNVLRRTLEQDYGVQLLWLTLIPPERDTIDYKWASMLTYTIWEHIEVEHLMSWLSTLGGGFSALGEQFERCAKTAGTISLQQLTIGLRLGDPFLQARCKLYYSISLIQRGQLRQAKHLIRAQYRFARAHKEHDQRLMRMCLGIWLRLRFEYQERRGRRINGRR